MTSTSVWWERNGPDRGRPCVVDGCGEYDGSLATRAWRRPEMPGWTYTFVDGIAAQYCEAHRGKAMEVRYWLSLRRGFPIARITRADWSAG